MTWVKLDDGFFRNRKARGVGKNGRELYLAALCYCADRLTDGFIPKSDIGLIAAEAEVRTTVAGDLVTAGLWAKRGDDGWLIPDYLHFNKSAEQVKREREEGRKRAEASAARKREASGEAQGEASGGASAPPSRSRPSGVSSVDSSSSVVPVADDDDDDSPTAQKWRELWPMLAKRAAHEYRQRGGTIGNEPGFLRTDAERKRAEYGERARKLLADRPDLTVEQLADLLLSPPRSVRPSKPELCTDSACVNGWLEDEAGDVKPCPTCRAAS